MCALPSTAALTQVCGRHKQKRMREIKKKIKRGLIDPDKVRHVNSPAATDKPAQDDPFELFISATDIRYTYYAETHKVLGNTFGMCVLQVAVLIDVLAADQRRRTLRPSRPTSWRGRSRRWRAAASLCC